MKDIAHQTTIILVVVASLTTADYSGSSDGNGYGKSGFQSSYDAGIIGEYAGQLGGGKALGELHHYGESQITPEHGSHHYGDEGESHFSAAYGHQADGGEEEEHTFSSSHFDGFSENLDLSKFPVDVEAHHYTGDEGVSDIGLGEGDHHQEHQYGGHHEYQSDDHGGQSGKQHNLGYNPYEEQAKSADYKGYQDHVSMQIVPYSGYEEAEQKESEKPSKYAGYENSQQAFKPAYVAPKAPSSSYQSYESPKAPSSPYQSYESQKTPSPSYQSYESAKATSPSYQSYESAKTPSSSYQSYESAKTSSPSYQSYESAKTPSSSYQSYESAKTSSPSYQSYESAKTPSSSYQSSPSYPSYESAKTPSSSYQSYESAKTSSPSYPSYESAKTSSPSYQSYESAKAPSSSYQAYETPKAPSYNSHADKESPSYESVKVTSSEGYRSEGEKYQQSYAPQNSGDTVERIKSASLKDFHSSMPKNVMSINHGKGGYSYSSLYRP